MTGVVSRSKDRAGQKLSTVGFPDPNDYCYLVPSLSSCLSPEMYTTDGTDAFQM